MNPRHITAAFVLTLGAACLGAASQATAQAPAAAAETSATLKPKFTQGLELRYRVIIDRKDSNFVPRAMLPGGGKEPDAKPKDDGAPKDAPKSDPKLTDPAPDHGKPAADPAPAKVEPAKPADDKSQPKADDDKVAAVSRVVVDMVQVLKVKEVTDSGITLELTFESVKADVKMPEWASAFDSAKPEDDKDRDSNALQTFKPLVGATLTLSADKDGNITDVKGNESLQNAPSAAMSGYLQQFTGSDNIRINWNMILHAKKGGGTFKVGDTWTNDEAINVKQMASRFELQTTSTLRGVSAGVASIDSTGTMRLVSNDPARKPPFELKDASILETAMWTTADGFSKSIEFQRSFRLDGSAQGFPLTRQSDIKLTAERAK